MRAPAWSYGPKASPAVRSSGVCPAVPSRQNQAVSPVRNCLCAQDDLEPVLRRFAEADRAGELRFNAELVAAAQDAQGRDAAAG